MEKIIKLGSQEVRMRASALIPRLYRAKIGRDIINDMNELQKSLSNIREKASKGEHTEFSINDLTIFENIAYILSYNADKTIGETPDEWLDTIESPFSIYEVLPEILELWVTTNKTTSHPFQNI